MTLPEITADLLRLVRHGGCSSAWNYLTNVGQLADRLTLRCIAVAGDISGSTLTLDLEQPLVSGNIGQLGNTLDSWTKLLFAGGGTPNEVMFRINRIVQLSQSISVACADELAETGTEEPT